MYKGYRYLKLGPVPCGTRGTVISNWIADCFVILLQGHAWSAAGIEEAGTAAGSTHACLHGSQVLPQLFLLLQMAPHSFQA